MRHARIERETGETTVLVEFDLDGSGATTIATGIEFFDHMLDAFATHGRFDLTAEATGDFDHHIAEDTMIALGRALEVAIDDKRGIRRVGHALFPMDDALAMVALDLSGRSYSEIDIVFNDTHLADLRADLYVHLLETFASNAHCNLHAEVLRGENDHHKAEAVAKGLGAALDEAVTVVGDDVPSTKGTIE